jgi:acyl-CoA dehydrogenase
VDTAERLFRDLCTPVRLREAEKGAFDADAWTRVTEAGLTFALVPENAGGFGMPAMEALQIAQIAGEHQLPLPLCETMIAAWALGTLGLDIPEGPLTIAHASTRDSLRLVRKAERWRLTGVAHRAPWGRHARAIAVCAIADDGPRLACVDRSGFTAQNGYNLAVEPRDTLTFDAALPDNRVAIAESLDAGTLRAAGAIMRSLQMAGALTRLLAMTITYAQDRVQFGKSLSQFQVIQHSIAILATQAAAATAAASLASDSFSDMRIDGIAAAKARIGEAASIAAPIAHQIHGAMGFTYEHPLHFVTKRLMSWREEFGGERQWQTLLGARVRERSADGAWAYLSSI